MENTYNLVRWKPFFKPNFLTGPFKPMYGIVPVLLVILIQPAMPLELVLFLCLIVPLLVEYITGALLLRLFSIRYWDYRYLRFQLHGHVALGYAICWMVLSYGVVIYLHPSVRTLYMLLSRDWLALFPLYFIYFTLDVIWAVRRHLNLRKSSIRYRPI